MAEFPALMLWTDAYLADTATLSEGEHGIYLLMLMYSWRTPNCCLPADDKQLSRMLRISVDKWRRRYKPTMMTFFYEKDGNLYQKRLQKERKKMAKRSASARQNANARWLINNDSADADASDPHGDPHMLPIPHLIPIPIDSKKNSNSSHDGGEELQRNGPSYPHLKSATFDKAHEIAPGHDIYHIEQQWRDGGYAANARKPDAAFLAFVKTHAKSNPV